MMQPQNPPSKIARLSNYGNSRISFGSYGGGRSPQTGSGRGLNLELGSGSGQGCGGSKSNGFTFLQLQELEHQALIFNYIKAGLAVPQHLVLPIWQSFAGSLSGLGDGSIQPVTPNLREHSSFYCYYRESMEPEPGRCRRTDGKKWRCSKEVVPNHKYCEKHIHRGRQRSRKPVESPPPIAAAAAALSSVSPH